MQEKEIFESTEESIVIQACEILKENEIPFVRKDEGSGSYLNKTWGSNSGIKKIFVSDNDYDKAMKLLEVFNEDYEDYEIIEIPEELKDIPEDDKEMEKDINKYKKMKRILFFGVPFIMFVIALITLIISSLWEGGNRNGRIFTDDAKISWNKRRI